jgi:transcriptional regulator with GAF, ATPase, and Fis domain
MNAQLLALERETSVASLLSATARVLVEALDASACTISRAIGDLLVELVDYSPTGPVQAGHGYLISDYPATRDVLEQLRPAVVSVSDPDADPKEVELLRELGFEALLMLALEHGGEAWALVEVYGGRTDGFTDEAAATARHVVERAAAVLTRVTGSS